MTWLEQLAHWHADKLITIFDRTMFSGSIFFFVKPLKLFVFTYLYMKGIDGKFIKKALIKGNVVTIVLEKIKIK